MQFLIFSLLGLRPCFSRISHSPLTRALVSCACILLHMSQKKNNRLLTVQHQGDHNIVLEIEIDPVDNVIHLLNNYRARLNLFPEFNESKTKTNFIKLRRCIQPLVVSANHSSSGQVSVQLRNRGSDGYKKAEYGDSIIIERKITAEGGSSYKIKSTEGTVLSSLFLPLRI